MGRGRGLSAAERYEDHLRHERAELEDFVETEREYADDLMCWYRRGNTDMPDDEYRGAAYFINSEFNMKPASLVLLYTIKKNIIAELPSPTKETALDLLRFRFRTYALTLEEGGF